MSNPTDTTPLLAVARPERFASSRRLYIVVASVVALFLAVAACGTVTGVSPALNPISTLRKAWMYDNPAKWLPNWGSSMSDPPNGEGMGKFTLRTSCKSAELKKNYADFWLDGEKEAYIVHHNYGTQDWFTQETAIKMERKLLDAQTGEYGYTVDTAEVDYEFGFAMKNLATDEWLYEIGRGSETPLFNEPCVQQFGAYWNRIRTSQPNPANVDYVLGTCLPTCPADYLDTANQLRTNDGVIPFGGELIIGKSDDARLLTIHSAILGKWIRSSSSRDTKFAESENESRHFVAHVDAYGPDLTWSRGTAYLLMVQLKAVKKANDDIALSVVETRYHKWDRECSTSFCSASVYDLTEVWYDPKTVPWVKNGLPAREVSAPLFTLGVKGDTRVSFYERQYEDDAYLTEATLFNAGEWGSDLDARRVTPVSGAIAGSVWWEGRSIRNYHPMADETTPATAKEKTWIFGVLGGGSCGERYAAGGINDVCITMTKVKIFVADDGSLKIKNIESRKIVAIPYEALKGALGVFTADVMVLPKPIGELFNSATIKPSLATSSRVGQVGISGFKFVMAPEMVPSLSKIDIVGLKAATAASSQLGRSAESTSADLGQTAIPGNLEYVYPHFFNHEYPGTEGCQATCEGNSIDETQCASMVPCEWYQGKCWSKVAGDSCPTDANELAEEISKMSMNNFHTLSEGQGCTIECEFETETECLNNAAMCVWTGGACFSQFKEPCPVTTQ